MASYDHCTHGNELQILCLVCRYGSKHNRYTNQQNIVIQSWNEGIKIAQQRIKIRYRHDYKAKFLTPELS